MIYYYDNIKLIYFMMDNIGVDMVQFLNLIQVFLAVPMQNVLIEFTHCNLQNVMYIWGVCIILNYRPL